jgi:hypothetical protein
MHRHVEPVIAALHRRSVERAAAVRHLGAPARRALVRRLVDAVLDEEQFDTAVGGSLERLLPTGRRAPIPARLFAPAVEQLRLLAAPPAVDHRTSRLEDPRRICMRLGSRPADEARLHFVRKESLEVRAHVIRADEDDARAAEGAHT